MAAESTATEGGETQILGGGKRKLSEDASHPQVAPQQGVALRPRRNSASVNLVSLLAKHALLCSVRTLCIHISASVLPAPCP
jgi:hypothetical protein